MGRVQYLKKKIRLRPLTFKYIGEAFFMISLLSLILKVNTGAAYLMAGSKTVRYDNLRDESDSTAADVIIAHLFTFLCKKSTFFSYSRL